MDILTTNWTDFVIGVIGSLVATGIVAAISAAKKWPPVPVPMWVLVLTIALPITWMAIAKLKRPPKPVVDQSFEMQRIVLDGKKFIRCKFDRCTLVFKGDAPFGLERCSFTAPKLVFESAASVTMFQIGLLRGDPVFEALITDALKKP